ncbi:MAG: RNA polymerase sigma factor [Bacteroidetes bacterium]|nr:RNA polymerase sigma factor [Bacteroidota bacterium]
MKLLTDLQLIGLLKQGEKGSFEEIYSRYSQKIFSFFYRMLWKDKQLAEDCTQELFLKLIKHSSTFDETKSFSTWLYSIANNMCKNEYRKAEVRKRNSILNAETIAKPENPDWKRFKGALLDYVNKLSDEKKSLYILRFQENLPLSEIGEILNIPEGTVKSRIFYLLKELKIQLKPYETLITYP